MSPLNRQSDVRGRLPPANWQWRPPVPRPVIPPRPALMPFAETGVRQQPGQYSHRSPDSSARPPARGALTG